MKGTRHKVKNEESRKYYEQAPDSGPKLFRAFNWASQYPDATKSERQGPRAGAGRENSDRRLRVCPDWRVASGQ